MVVSTIRRDEGCRFVIRPNRSLSWLQIKIVFASLAAPCLLFALGFALLGYWPVLPFAGAEVVALAIGFYICALGGRETEVIWIKENLIAIEKGNKGTRSTRCELDRSWARVELLPSRIHWYPSRLVIRSRGKQVQLGAFLTDGERERLARELKRVISSEEMFSVAVVEAESTLV